MQFYPLIFRALLLTGFVKLLLIKNKPFLYSGIYTGAAVAMDFAAGRPWLPAVLFGALRFALASLYFWLLGRFEETPLVWWVILVVGGLIVLL